MDQSAFAIEEGVVAGVLEPEGLGPGPQGANEDTGTAWINAFVDKGLHNQRRSPEPPSCSASLTGDHQEIGRLAGGEAGVGLEELGGLRFAGRGGGGPGRVGPKWVEKRRQINPLATKPERSADSGDAGGVGGSGREDRQQSSHRETGQMDPAVIGDGEGGFHHCTQPIGSPEFGHLLH